MRTKLILLGWIVVVFSCKKKNDVVNPPTPGGGTSTVEDLLMDSVYLYSKEIYFWNNLIPAYDQFNPRQYKGADQLSSAQNVMTPIRNVQPHDRYSFVTTIEESDGIQTGEDRDYGFFVKAASIDVAAPVDSVYWFVNYVYDRSTAGTAGVKRGWIVNKIGGTTLGYNQSSADLLNTTFFGTSATANFEFIKPDKTTTSASLSKSSFTANSVLYKGVINTG